MLKYHRNFGYFEIHRLYHQATIYCQFVTYDDLLLIFQGSNEDFQLNFCHDIINRQTFLITIISSNIIHNIIIKRYLSKS